jgi:hypothetical protein
MLMFPHLLSLRVLSNIFIAFLVFASCGCMTVPILIRMNNEGQAWVINTAWCCCWCIPFAVFGALWYYDVGTPTGWYPVGNTGWLYIGGSLMLVSCIVMVCAQNIRHWLKACHVRSVLNRRNAVQRTRDARLRRAAQKEEEAKTAEADLKMVLNQSSLEMAALGNISLHLSPEQGTLELEAKTPQPAVGQVEMQALPVTGGGGGLQETV